MLEPIFRFDRPGGARYVNAAISAGQAGQLAGLLREREGRRLAVQLERATLMANVEWLEGMAIQLAEIRTLPEVVDRSR